ncbi:hypothetical protein K488DRAFT_54632 [Vararia minispora EC-137]|uniref:Uncharacterized protein n=1 Tax=Vararia minispora EC-137 TaxID=1314806 RepID=A0ACB8QEX6_9AGAM|nr:hypothetical protein K488DRAFT_54632 [Vararia minispora EC-137]
MATSRQGTVFTTTPLSSVSFEHARETIVSAFNLCKDADERLCAQGADSSDSPLCRRLVGVRILGHLLRHAPSDTAVSHIAKSIVSTKRRDAPDAGDLADLGMFYEQHLIRRFRRFKGRTPQPSSHSSRVSLDFNEKIIQSTLVEAPLSHSTAKNLVFARDEYRCMLSGKVHEPYWTEVYSLKHQDAEHPSYTFAECAHVFPESMNTRFQEKDELKHATNAWTVMRYLGFPSIVDELKGDKIHSLENMLTLEPFLHAFFDRLCLWLEPDLAIPNCYHVGSVKPLESIGIMKSVVTFKSHVQDPPLPLPKADYLRIHASCCKVAHLSGASKLYDQLERELDSDPDSGTPEFASALLARLELIQHYGFVEGSPEDNPP